MMKEFNFDLHIHLGQLQPQPVTPLIAAVLMRAPTKICLTTMIAPKVSYSSMSQSRCPWTVKRDMQKLCTEVVYSSR